jgi:hypothetical protein
MQTTKWGPAGWRLLFAIASNYPDQPTSQDRLLYQFIYTHIANILPCVFCRQSYRQFTQELPIDNWLDNRHTLMYHLYLIHNKVNDKLRQQGYLHYPNPPFQEVEAQYLREKTYQDCGWDFLYAIIFNYPITPHESDKYNYNMFFHKLKLLLPYEPVRASYAKYWTSHPITNSLSCRDTLIHWFYDAHQAIAHDLGLSQFPKYEDVCEKYEDFRASCNIKKTNTCRTSAKTTQPENTDHGDHGNH